MDKRETFKFLGRTIGTGTGWDGDLGEEWMILDFQPVPGIVLPEADALGINDIEGEFRLYDDSGNVTQRWDIIEILRTVPLSRA